MQQKLILIFRTSILLFVSTISGVLGQWPIGYLSDKFDRRSVRNNLWPFICILFILTSNDPLENIYWLSELHFKKFFFYIYRLYTSFCYFWPDNLVILTILLIKITQVSWWWITINFGLRTWSNMFYVYANFWFKRFFLFFNNLSFNNWYFWIIGWNKNCCSKSDSTTPVPVTITPAGLELDPDTPETLENKKNLNYNFCFIILISLSISFSSIQSKLTSPKLKHSSCWTE